MTTDQSLEQRITDALAAEAPARGPDRLADSVLAITAARSPRPRWLTLAKESPMALDHRAAFGSPLARTAALLTVTLLLALAATGTMVVGASLLPSPSPTVIPTHQSSFEPTGQPAVARASHTATLLPDGRVLVIGGLGGNATVDSAELWDPATGTFSATGSLAQGRSNHTATLLPDGRVLVVGGFDGPSTAEVTAELWDPATGTFSAAGSLAQGRWSHTATLLPDGRVLVIGGLDGNAMVASAELWDPATDTFSPAGSLAQGRWSHTATLLPDGRVLVIGGWVGTALSPESTASVELWDPATDTFSPAASLDQAASGHTATPLGGGRVLVVGGGGDLASAELWDTVSATFSSAGSLPRGRRFHSATLLPDGRVLVVGESSGALCVECTVTAESWDPATGMFSPAGSLRHRRAGHTATLLPDGRVLVVGGSDGQGEVASAELWNP